jgi:hypothetical protein
MQGITNGEQHHDQKERAKRFTLSTLNPTCDGSNVHSSVAPPRVMLILYFCCK